MDLEAITSNLDLYVEGLATTLQLVVASLLCGLCLAVPLAVVASSRNPLVRALPRLYIYVFRGTPLLVQTFIIYYGLPQFDLLRDSPLYSFTVGEVEVKILKEAYWCALLAFTLNTAAYTGEILRGAIEQTPFGEVEAARACGMSPTLILRRVVLPSAFRRALPAYANEVIFMLHGSAIAGVITIVDLFGAARIVNSRHFVPFESFITAGFFYLCMTFLIVWVFKLWERRWHAHLRARA